MIASYRNKISIWITTPRNNSSIRISSLGNKKTLCTILTLFFIVSSLLFTYKPKVKAQDSLPTFTATNTGESVLANKISEFPYNMELAPLVYTKENGEKIYLYSTSWSLKCDHNGNLLENGGAIPYTSCDLVTKPDILGSLSSNGTQNYVSPSEVNPNTDWNFSYNGITGLAVETINNKKYLFAIRHNEHSNSNLGGYLYQGRIYPNILAENCASGYQNGTYAQCWESFASFASLLRVELSSDGSWDNSSEVTDLGPIAWPETGYRQSDGAQITAGPYHPTLFSDGEYLYAYYIKNSGLESGQRQCFGVSRAPLASLGEPNSWKSYSGGSFSTESLPTGFNKSQISNFYDKQNGGADCIGRPGSFSDAALYFNVAKVIGTDYYIAAEESAKDGANWQMGLRISKDLVNWSEMQVLETAPGAWGNGTYSYPTFIDSEGAFTNKEVDPTDFYLLGKHATNTEGYELNAMHLSLQIDDTGGDDGGTGGDTGSTGNQQCDDLNFCIGNIIENYGTVDDTSDFNGDNIINGFDFVEVAGG